MVIFYFMQNFQDDPAIYWLGVIGLHLLLIAYFGIMHRKWFKNLPRDKRFAIAVNLIGIGAGQAYNRRMIKAFVFFGLVMASVVIAHLNFIEENIMLWVTIGIYIAALIDSYKDALLE